MASRSPLGEEGENVRDSLSGPSGQETRQASTASSSTSSTGPDLELRTL